MPNDKQLKDKSEEFLTPSGKPVGLRGASQQLTRSLRSTQEIGEEPNDVATASLLENWIEA